ncbi:MAG: hypothetical protein LBI69_02540 [Puniceicoccales bacterium]|jgi:hypothetical protein|nr:hypothetical protein [Puniceicoccales bacterium]
MQGISRETKEPDVNSTSHDNSSEPDKLGPTDAAGISLINRLKAFATSFKLSGNDLIFVALPAITGIITAGAFLFILSFVAKVALAGWLIGLLIGFSAMIGLATGSAMQIIYAPEEVKVAKHNIPNLANELKALKALANAWNALDTVIVFLKMTN